MITTDDGVRLWAERTGPGDSEGSEGSGPCARPALVLCHGGPGLWDMFGQVAAGLSDVYEVHRWDQRGCGRSEGGAGPYTVERALPRVQRVTLKGAGHMPWAEDWEGFRAAVAPEVRTAPKGE
ncbi:alpha/beta fold hydrolase [Streptomyces sp. NPDC004788]